MGIGQSGGMWLAQTPGFTEKPGVSPLPLTSGGVRGGPHPVMSFVTNAFRVYHVKTFAFVRPFEPLAIKNKNIKDIIKTWRPLRLGVSCLLSVSSAIVTLQT